MVKIVPINLNCSICCKKGDYSVPLRRYQCFECLENGNDEENMDKLTAELVKKGYNLEETELKEKDWFAVELEYQSRQDRNDKGQLCFEFPIIIRTREDKPLSECEV